MSTLVRRGPAGSAPHRGANTVASGFAGGLENWNDVKDDGGIPGLRREGGAESEKDDEGGRVAVEKEGDGGVSGGEVRWESG